MVAPLIAIAGAGLKVRLQTLAAERILKATGEIEKRYARLHDRAAGQGKNNWREGARSDVEFIRTSLRDILDFQKNHGGMSVKDHVLRSNGVIGATDVLLRGLDQNLKPDQSRLRLSAGLPALAMAVTTIVPPVRELVQQVLGRSQQAKGEREEDQNSPEPVASRNHARQRE